jgi:hypothetical protein
MTQNDLNLRDRDKAFFLIVKKKKKKKKKIEGFYDP